MNVLVLNTGSSSVKFAVLGVRAGSLRDSPSTMLARASVKGLGGLATLDLSIAGGRQVTLECSIADHREAIQWIFEQLQSLRVESGGAPLLRVVEAAGHRIVHGGDRFQDAVRIDDAVLEEIQALSAFAPLHNPAGLAGVRAAQAALGPHIPNIAVTKRRLRCPDPSKTGRIRSEEHTSELQSQSNLVCRLLLEKKNIKRGDGPRHIHHEAGAPAPTVCRHRGDRQDSGSRTSRPVSSMECHGALAAVAVSYRAVH